MHSTYVQWWSHGRK